MYGEVKRVMKNGVSVRGIGPHANLKWTISKEEAALWGVVKREFDAFEGDAILRRPVVVLTDELFMHGQVVKCSADSIDVSTSNREVSVESFNVSVTAPVVALLLRNVTFDANSWSLDEIKDIQNELLDRLLGTGAVKASKKIAHVLEDIVEEPQQPSANHVIRWIIPSTGQLCQFELQHAVDFIHFADGGKASMPSHVGKAFCFPAQHSRPLRSVKKVKAMAKTTNPAQTGLFDAQDLQVEDDAFWEEEDSEYSDDPAPQKRQLSRPRTWSRPK